MAIDRHTAKQFHRPAFQSVQTNIADDWAKPCNLGVAHVRREVAGESVVWIMECDNPKRYYELPDGQLPEGMIRNELRRIAEIWGCGNLHIEYDHPVHSEGPTVDGRRRPRQRSEE